MIMNPVDEPYSLALGKLNTLENNHLKQFKELGTISEIMKKVIYCTIHLVDENFTRFDWNNALQRLGDNEFINNVKHKPVDKISQTSIKKVSRMIDQDHDKLLKDGSPIIQIFYKWVITTIDYKNGEKKSAPYRKKVQDHTTKANDLKDKIQKFNEAKEKSYEIIQDKKASQEDLEKQNKEYDNEINNTNMRLRNAFILKKLKEDEYNNWTN